MKKINYGYGLVAAFITALIITIGSAQVVPVDPPTSGGGGGGGSVGVPTSLPIGDVADLQAYNWEKTAYISVYGWSSSSINSTTNVKTSVWLEYLVPNGAVEIDDVLAVIKAQQLILSVLYQSDSITLGVNTYDKDYQRLFYSYSGSSINPPKNGVSKNVLDVVLEMDSSTWLDYMNASWFYIVERDDNNNPIRYYYPGEGDIQNGRIRYPNYFARKNGELVMTQRDGTQIAYRLNGGQRMETTTVQIGIGKVSALGARTFRGNSNSNLVAFVEVTFEESERNINPLAQLVVTGEKPSFVAFASWRSGDPNQRGGAEIVEYASTVNLWVQGKTSASSRPIEMGPTHTLLRYLEPGRYWLRYNFASGWPTTQNQFSSPYNDGGGKGKGVVATPVTSPVSNGSEGVGAEPVPAQIQQ